MDKREKNPSKNQENRADAKKAAANQPNRNPASQFEHGQQHLSSSTATQQPVKQQGSQAQTPHRQSENKNIQQKKK